MSLRKEPHKERTLLGLDEFKGADARKGGKERHQQPAA